MPVNSNIDSLISSANGDMTTLLATISQAKTELPTAESGIYYFDNDNGSFWRILRGSAAVYNNFPEAPSPRPYVKADPTAGGIEFEVDFGRAVTVTWTYFWHSIVIDPQPFQIAHKAEFYAENDTLIATGGSWSGSTGGGGGAGYGWYRTHASWAVPDVRRVRFFYTNHTHAIMTAEIKIDAP